LDINPAYSPAQASLAWVYLAGKDNPGEALNYFDKVLEKTKSPMLYFGKGLSYAKQGDNARVLEMVTELKSMGAIDLATQLERGIRRNETVPMAAPAAVEPQTTGERGTLIQSAPAENPRETKPGPGSPISGQMQIRLKGSLQNTPSSGKKKSSSPDHPGSLQP